MPSRKPVVNLHRYRSHIEDLQARAGVQFRNPNLLLQALAHRSYLNESEDVTESNERLEFLGDAVLGLITAQYLYRRLRRAQEGELTSIRAALVRTEALADYAARMGLGDYLLLGKGEELSQGRQRVAGLASAFEAIIGAIYIDRGYLAAKRFVLGFIEPAMGDVIAKQLHRNAKSILQELIQGRYQLTPTYRLIGQKGPDHQRIFTMEVRVGETSLGSGQAHSKQAAEQAAAMAALEALEDDAGL